MRYAQGWSAAADNAYSHLLSGQQMSKEERGFQGSEEGRCQFRTPVKHPTTTTVASSYCASSLQEIASRIKSNAEKRFRQRQESGEYFLIFWSDLKQVNESSKPKSALSLDCSLSAQEVEARIRRERLRLSKAESLRTERYERLQGLLLVLRGAMKEQTRLSTRLKSLRVANSICVQQIQYEQFHRTNQSVLDQAISKLQTQIHQQQFTLTSIINLHSDIPTLKAKKAEQLAKLSMLQATLISQQKHLHHLRSELHPSVEVMVHCMFLIGVLNEQIDIAVMLRKEKRALKQNGEKAVNRSYKLGQRMARREMVVDCKNSLIAELVAAVGIYMHCKSLTISNLSTLMNTLSFFSQEFKEIYCYPTFRKYVGSYFFGKQESLADETATTDPLKKKLIIRTKHQHLPLLKTILRAFQGHNQCYSVFLQPYCMAIQAQPESAEVTDCEDNLLQNNELKMTFADYDM